MTDPKQLRKYLLGLLTDEAETEQLEVRLLADEEFLETLLAEEDELIDDFVDGTLSDEEREAFEKNFVVTNERREKILFARAAQHKFASAKRTIVDLAAKPGVWEMFRSFFAINRLATAAALGVLVVGCFIAVWFLVIRSNKDDAVLASLNRAFQNERPVNARISGLDYAPFSERRGPKSIVSDENALRRAENISRDAVYESETAENLHDLGKLQIAKREFAEAKKTLEKALAKKPDDPAILNELGIAELIAADNAKSGGEQLRLVATALEHFDKAVRVSPKFAEAWFNRALTIGKLNVPGQEAAAWRDYLNIDSTSKWADEARSRLTQLESQSVVPITAAELVEEFLTAYRQRDDETAFRRLSENKEMITGKLVFQQLAFLFTDAEPESDRSKELLSAMQYAADLELKKTGDKFWKHLADYYTQNGAAKRNQLKTAQDEVRAAYTDTLANQYESAKPRFETAKKIFDTTGNDGESMIMDYWIAYLDQQATRLKAAKDRLIAANERSERLGYMWLNSHFKGWLSQIELFDDNAAKRIELDKQALLLAETTFDDFQKQRLSDSLASSYLQLGMADSSCEYLARSLRSTQRKYRSDRQHYRSLVQAATILAKLKYYAAAYNVLSEAVDWNDSRIRDKGFVYSTKFLLGQIEAARGNFEYSFDHFDRALDATAEMSEDTRERHKNYVDLLRAHALREARKCSEAIPIYERVLIQNESGESVLDRFDNRRGLLYCRLDIGQSAEANSETPVIIDLLDRYRSLIRSEAAGNSFFADVQEVYDRLIDHRISQGDTASALQYSEMSRSRTLLDLIKGSTSSTDDAAEPDIKLSSDFTRPLGNDEIFERLPSNVQLLVYNVLENRLAITLITENGVRLISSEISREDLGQLADRFMRSVSTPGKFAEDRGSSAKDLEHAIFEPVRSLVDPKIPVAIVPDKMLNRVPFGALTLDDDTFLAEQFEFLYTPSVSLFILATEEAENRRAFGDESLLAVGDPEFDQTEFADYSRLDAAKNEARNIGAIYGPNSEILVGADASVSSVRSRLENVSVFHYAGHYHSDPVSPLHSGLLLAGSGRSSLLTNREMVGKRMPRMRLAILSACTTGSEQVIDSEGMIGAARMFLANGVPEVVASHWEIDSATSSRLMFSFHTNRRPKATSTTGALRAAQLELINNPDQTTRDPYYWAAFFVIGGKN